jgi:predicted acetyltransferase
MSKTELRRLVDQEARDVMFPLGMYAFRASPPFMDREEWEKYARQRQGITYFAMFEDDVPAAGAGSTSMHENVRGALYPASAVWGVAAHPAARRKGYVRQIMTALLAAEREAGKVLSALYPFRESFYERLGYASLPQTRQARFSASATAPLLKKELGGRVVLKQTSEAYETYREFILKLRPQVHGMGVFDFGSPGSTVRWPAWAALAYGPDELEGIMLYTLQGEEITQFTLHAARFYYLTSRARALLLEWIARHIDQAAQVEINLAPYEQPELWLTDLKVKTSTREPTPMGRVLDLARLGGMHTSPGSFTALVSDPVCPWNTGCWRFETRDGCLQVSPAQQQSAAEGELSIQAVTALVYGTLDPQDFSLRGWGDPSPALQATLRTMFPKMTAHLHEEF